MAGEDNADKKTSSSSSSTGDNKKTDTTTTTTNKASKKIEKQELSEEDLQKKQEVDLLAERVQDVDAGVQKLALDTLREEIRTSTAYESLSLSLSLFVCLCDAIS
jgi:26S proteasome regulatory subunit N1